MKKVLVVSAHPDDETLGCGGTLLKHRDHGDEIYWLITTSITEDIGFDKEKITERNEEIKKVENAYKITKTYKLDYNTMSLSSEILTVMIPKVSQVINDCKPEVIYTVNRSDAHSDHKYTFDSVLACTKSFRYPYIKKVLMYECLSETEFAPTLPENIFMANYFEDISEQIYEKCEIMEIFDSELGAHPFPRSIRNIKALATYRGASVGVEYAEAFQVIKIINK